MIAVTSVTWQSVATIAASVVVLLTPILAVLGYGLRATTRSTVESIIATEVTPRLDRIDGEIAALHEVDSGHAQRLARLEGVQEGKVFQQRQQTITGGTG